MNEVRSTVLAGQTLARSTSSTGASEKKEKSNSPEVSAPETGEARVKQTELAEKTEKESNAREAQDSLQSAVASINDYVQLVQRDLHFTVDDDLERTVIKVVDSHSGELIRQIPEDVFLELARKLREDGELHLVSALG